VDLEEAKAIMLPRGCTDQQVEMLFHKADKNNDNKLDYSEFAAFWDIPIN
jgi:Ca2+-binding EF-hand superfamily protein